MMFMAICLVPILALTKVFVHSGNLRHGFIHRSDTREPWGIRGVLSPQYGEPSFADYIGCPELVRYVQGFTRSQRLGLGAITIFTNPRDRPFTIGWHRDNGSPGGTKTPILSFSSHDKRFTD